MKSPFLTLPKKLNFCLLNLCIILLKWKEKMEMKQRRKDMMEIEKLEIYKLEMKQ